MQTDDPTEQVKYHAAQQIEQIYVNQPEDDRAYW
jgi:hypothetical protein